MVQGLVRLLDICKLNQSMLNLMREASSYRVQNNLISHMLLEMKGWMAKIDLKHSWVLEIKHLSVQNIGRASKFCMSCCLSYLIKYVYFTFCVCFMERVGSDNILCTHLIQYFIECLQGYRRDQKCCCLQERICFYFLELFFPIMCLAVNLF